MDLVQDGIDDAIGQDIHRIRKVGGESALAVARRGHARVSWSSIGVPASASSRPDSRSGVGEPGLRRPEGTGVIGDLGQRQPEGVVEDEDGPLFWRQAPEAAVELIAIVHRHVLVTRGRFRTRPL